MERFVVDVDVEKYFEIIRGYEDMIKTIDVLRSSYNRGFLTEKLKNYYEQYIGNNIENKFREIIEDLDVLLDSINNSLWMLYNTDSNLHDELNRIIDDNFNTDAGVTDEIVVNNVSSIREQTAAPGLMLFYKGRPVAHDSTIIMRPGETIYIDVLLPPYYGDDIRLWRTNASGSGQEENADSENSWNHYFECSSEPFIDRNDASKAKFISTYRWKITAKEGSYTYNSPYGDRGVMVSQTAQYSTESDSDIKSMGRLKIYVIPDDVTPPSKVAPPDYRYDRTTNTFRQLPLKNRTSEDGKVYKLPNDSYWGWEIEEENLNYDNRESIPNDNVNHNEKNNFIQSSLHETSNEMKSKKKK